MSRTLRSSLSVPLEMDSLSDEHPDLEDFKDDFGRPLTRYEKEKDSGKRKANGILKLKKLTNRHMRIIQMHLKGWSGGAIAVQLNCSQMTVSKILNDPLSQGVIQQALEDSRGEINALMPKAVQAVREGFADDASLTMRFKAIDKLKVLKEMSGSGERTRTAEDLVQELLSSGTKFNLQISNMDSPGEKDITPITLEE